MSRRKSQKAMVPSPPTNLEPVAGIKLITVTGTLPTGVKVTQDLNIHFKPGQTIGDVAWTAVEILKRIGGILEDADQGFVFYPLHSFVGGITFTEKVQ